MKKKNDEPSKLLEVVNSMLAFIGTLMIILCVCLWSVEYMTVPQTPKEEPRTIIDLPQAQSHFVQEVTHLHSVWYGTGFMLKYGARVINVSNAHVCQDHDDPENPISIKGKYLKVGGVVEQVIAIDEENDLCLITNSNGSHLGLNLLNINDTISQLDRVYTIGFPKVGEQVLKEIKEGRVLDAETISMRTLGGQSGSPIMNSQGAVIGVIHSRQVNHESRGVFTGVARLREFVKYELYGLGRDQ